MGSRPRREGMEGLKKTGDAHALRGVFVANRRSLWYSEYVDYIFKKAPIVGAFAADFPAADF